MKQTIIAFLMLFIALGAFAQEQEPKKLTRKEKQEILKLERAKEDSILRAVTDVIITNKQFVLEADQLRDRYGNMAFVTSNINFIAVDSNVAVFQFGSAHTVGINGIGGVTVEGRITSFKAKKNEKNGSYYIQFNISSNLGMFDISMNVSGDGRASATVNAMSRGKLNYSGKLVSLQTSNVYKGMSW
jgi:hypothetical protein